MFNLKKRFKKLIAFPKTIYFNFKVLSFKEAVKLPFWISADTVLRNIKRNNIKINGQIKRYMIRVGVDSGDTLQPPKKTVIDIGTNSCVCFGDNVEMATGTVIRLRGNSKMIIGDNFFCNQNCTFVARESIEIGNDVLIGWNVTIRDSDGGNHYIIKNNQKKENCKKIKIHNHVRICANVSIMKGVEIFDDCVVAYNSCVLKTVGKERNLIGGYPAKLLEEDIMWQK